MFLSRPNRSRSSIHLAIVVGVAMVGIAILYATGFPNIGGVLLSGLLLCRLLRS
jgi:hypothetical protein